MSVKLTKPANLDWKDPCEECRVRRGVVLSRYFNKLLCWGCYDRLSEDVNYKNRRSVETTHVAVRDKMKVNKTK